MCLTVHCRLSQLLLQSVTAAIDLKQVRSSISSTGWPGKRVAEQAKHVCVQPAEAYPINSLRTGFVR